MTELLRLAALIDDLHDLAAKYKRQAASSMEPRSRRDYCAGTHDGIMEAANRIEAALREDGVSPSTTLFQRTK